MAACSILQEGSQKLEVMFSSRRTQEQSSNVWIATDLSCVICNNDANATGK